MTTTRQRPGPRKTTVTAPPTHSVRHDARKKESQAVRPDDERYCVGQSGALVRLLKGSALGSPYSTAARAGDYWATYFASSPLVDQAASLFITEHAGTIALCHDGTAVTYDVVAGSWDPRGVAMLDRLSVPRLRKVVYDPARGEWRCYHGVHGNGWVEARDVRGEETQKVA